MRIVMILFVILAITKAGTTQSCNKTAVCLFWIDQFQQCKACYKAVTMCTNWALGQGQYQNNNCLISVEARNCNTSAKSVATAFTSFGLGSPCSDCSTIRHPQPARVWGDPHFVMWNKQGYDFHGPSNLPDTAQFYYVTPCSGFALDDMPFNVVGTHAKFFHPGQHPHSAIRGLDYITLELYPDLTTKYLIWLTGYNLASAYTSSTVNISMSALFNQTASQAGGSDQVHFTSTQTLYFGRFKVNFTQRTTSEINVVLDIDGSQVFKIRMLNQPYSPLPPTGPLLRYRLNDLTISLPEGFRCYVCGLLGDFSRNEKVAAPPNSVSGVLPNCTGGYVTTSHSNVPTSPNGLSWQTTACTGHGNRRRRAVASASSVFENMFCARNGNNWNVSKAACEVVTNAYQLLFSGNLKAIRNSSLSACIFDVCIISNGSAANATKAAQELLEASLKSFNDTRSVWEQLYDPTLLAPKTIAPSNHPSQSPSARPWNKSNGTTAAPTSNKASVSCKLSLWTLVGIIVGVVAL